MMEAKATPIASKTTPTPAMFGQTEQVLPANASTPPEFATTELGNQSFVSYESERLYHNGVW